MQYDEFPAMNTTVQVAAEGDLQHLQPGFDLVRSFVSHSEERFSRFLDTSELSRLNQAAGDWFHASPDLFDLVSEALAMHRLTNRLFDPSVLGALKRAGYQRSIEEIRHTVLPAAPESLWKPLPFEDTYMDQENLGIRLPPDVQIDLGGIAKGWIAARACELLDPFTEACAVSAGGDMALRGLPTGEQAWRISLEDPRNIEEVMAVLNIPPGGLATSTVTRRRWMQGGKSRHHIIDPSTGEPSTTPWLSVTAYAESPTLVEAFAKALLIAGPSQAEELASRVDGLRYLAVEADGGLVGSLEMVERMHVPEQIL